MGVAKPVLPVLWHLHPSSNLLQVEAKSKQPTPKRGLFCVSWFAPLAARCTVQAL